MNLLPQLKYLQLNHTTNSKLRLSSTTTTDADASTAAVFALLGLLHPYTNLDHMHMLTRPAKASLLFPACTAVDIAVAVYREFKWYHKRRPFFE